METYDALFNRKKGQRPRPVISPSSRSPMCSRLLGLEHAAGQLDAAAQKAIARNDAPTALLDGLMREQLRAQIRRARQDLSLAKTRS